MQARLDALEAAMSPPNAADEDAHIVAAPTAQNASVDMEDPGMDIDMDQVQQLPPGWRKLDARCGWKASPIGVFVAVGT
jgi:hypothetical protein